MDKIFTVASREFNAAVRSKAFVISLISMPIFMLGSVFVQMLLRRNEDMSDQRYAVVDRTPNGEVAQTLLAAVVPRNTTQTIDKTTGKQTLPKFVIEVVPPSSTDEAAIKRQRLQLSDEVREGKYLGFLEVGPEIVKPPASALPTVDDRGRPIGEPADKVSVRFQTNTPLKTDFADWCRNVVQGYVMLNRASGSGVSITAITDALKPVPVVVTRLTKVDAKTGEASDAKQENRVVGFLLPMMLSLLMFMMILVGTTPLLNSVLEEKIGRIAEVLLGSVTPFQLMAGKLIGMVGVSIVSVVIYLGGAYFAAYRFGYAEYVPLSLLGWFVLFQIMGVIMFGSLFIAIGAASTDAKESQSLVTPVMLLASLPFFVMVKVIEEPNGGLARAMSFFPFTAPSVMVMRLAVPPGVDWWQPFASMGVVILASIACVWAGGRVFRVGLLMQGKGANFGQMLKWIFKG